MFWLIKMFLFPTPPQVSSSQYASCSQSHIYIMCAMRAILSARGKQKPL